MTEYISNGTFTSDLTGWTNTSDDADWVYDATGAAHDGGSAKGTHDGAANTEERVRMYQDVSIADTDNIDTATMDAWIQLDDSKDIDVGESYAEFWVRLKDPAGTISTVEYITHSFGTSWDTELMTNFDVKAMLQAGGPGMWGVYLVCDILREDTEASWLATWFDDISLDIVYGQSNTVTGTVNVTGNTSSAVDFAQTIIGTTNISGLTTHKVDFLQTITGTVNLSGTTLGGGSKTLKTDYKYFLGTADGTIHLHSEDYKGDAGVVIPCQYETKDTDFSDQDQLANDRWKTVYAVKLFYEDMSASTDMVVAISTDGGATFPTSQTQTLGTGDETRKDVTFFFLLTGQFFRFRVSSGSASTTFKLLGMEVEYQDAGLHWGIA